MSTIPNHGVHTLGFTWNIISDWLRWIICERAFPLIQLWCEFQLHVLTMHCAVHHFAKILVKECLSFILLYILLSFYLHSLSYLSLLPSWSPSPSWSLSPSWSPSPSRSPIKNMQKEIWNLHFCLSRKNFALLGGNGNILNLHLPPDLQLRICRKKFNLHFCLLSSVADRGCLSRIPDPDFYPSRIPDPKTVTKERGEKKFVIILFFVVTNFTKLNIMLFWKC